MPLLQGDRGCVIVHDAHMSRHKQKNDRGALDCTALATNARCLHSQFAKVYTEWAVDRVCALLPPTGPASSTQSERDGGLARTHCFECQI